MVKDSLPDYPPMFSLSGPPIPIDPRFAAALASIIVEWSRVEMTFQTDLEGLRRYPGMIGLSPEMPRGFDRKLKLWRRTLRKLYAAIDSYQQYADYIRDSAASLALKRNHLIHGLWAIAGAGADGKWTVRNYKTVAGGGYQIVQSEINAENLEGTASAILKLSGDIAGFMASRMWHMNKGLLQVSHEP